MNIVINAVLAFEKPRGVGRYINNLLPEIAKNDTENHYYVYYGKWMHEYEFLNIRQDNFHFIELDIKNTQLARNLFLAAKLPLMAKKLNPDIFWLVDTQAIFFKPCKMVSTVHDLAEFEVPEKYSRKQALLRRMIVRNQVRLSDKILTVSNYSKQDICQRFRIPEARVAVTYNTVDRVVSPDEVTPDRHDSSFLFVSETERAKNPQLLIKAYSMLPEEYQKIYSLRIAGNQGNDHENCLQLIAETGIGDRVEFFGYLSREALQDLYASAYAFVFPSLFEGFGLPVLEAMAQGTPVLCSDSSSIPEVGGDAVLTFSPTSAEQLCAQMVKLIENPQLRETMIWKGLEQAGRFTKQNAALSTLNALFER